MTQSTDQPETQQPTPSVASQDNSPDAPQQLSQEEMQRRYLEQQQRLACPGCSEEPFLG